MPPGSCPDRLAFGHGEEHLRSARKILFWAISWRVSSCVSWAGIWLTFCHCQEDGGHICPTHPSRHHRGGYCLKPFPAQPVRCHSRRDSGGFAELPCSSARDRPASQALPKCPDH